MADEYKHFVGQCWLIGCCMGFKGGMSELVQGAVHILFYATCCQGVRYEGCSAMLFDTLFTKQLVQLRQLQPHSIVFFLFALDSVFSAANEKNYISERQRTKCMSKPNITRHWNNLMLGLAFNDQLRQRIDLVLKYTCRSCFASHSRFRIRNNGFWHRGKPVRWWWLHGQVLFVLTFQTSLLVCASDSSFNFL